MSSKLFATGCQKNTVVLPTRDASNGAMVERRIAGKPGNRFAFSMVLLLVLLLILVFTIHKHGSTQPNAGPPPNQRFHP
jgi:hypothetical protein